MDVVWDGRSDGSRDRQVVGFGDRSTGRDNFEGKCGLPHCNQSSGEFVAS